MVANFDELDIKWAPHQVDTMLKMGVEGDLLVFTPGVGKFDTWEQVVSFNTEATSRS